METGTATGTVAEAETAPPATGTAPPATGTAPPATGTDTATPALALHEWGLVDVDLAAGVAEISAGPGQPARPVVARKPVIYAHLRGEDAVSLDVRVRIPGGAILEHWPAGELGADTIRWHGDVTRGACSGGARGPVRDQPPCASADGFCETSELPRYVTGDHDCITTAAGPAALLFYRARVPVDALPLRFERAADLRVRAAGPTRPLLRISTGLTGPWPVGRRVIARGDAELAVGTALVDPAAERSAMERTLRELGLTAAEARVFLDAWAVDLFGAGAERESSRRPARAVAQDVILYWLTAAEIERIAPLEASIPVTTRRAWLVRVTLPGVATAGPAAP
jgi:hypothetical protein